MGRPKGLNLKTFHLYDKLHTTKVELFSGVEITALYCIKETDFYYMSNEVWSWCCPKFKHKKEGFDLKVNIPIIKDSKTIEFLEKECWKDYIERGGVDLKEAEALLNRLFPTHKKYFFYELSSIISAFGHGTFTEKKPNAIDHRKYMTSKYYKYLHDVPHIKALYDDYDKKRNSNKKDEAFKKYHEAERNYAYEHYCLDETFLEIGNNSVCWPVGFKESTADWHVKKYGKEIGYAHVGEIYFVVTEDTVYFEVTRHY